MRRETRKQSLTACFLYYHGFHPLLYREAMALRDAGYDIDIICLKNWADDKTLSTHEGFRIFKIHSRTVAEKSLCAYFTGLLFFFVKAFLLLGYLGIRKRYRVVHVTTPPDVMVFAALVPRLLGARILLDIHDIGPELFMRKLDVSETHPVITLLKFFEKISCNFAGHVITVTDIWRDKLVKRSVSPEKCSVLLNVPEDGLFRFLPNRPTKNSATFELYYHGSLEEHFGVDTLLAAMPLIRSGIPNVRLHIYAGKRGRILEYCLSYVRDHDLERTVEFHEGVPFYELPSILADADLGMVPTKNSVFADEAVSMKSLEYIFLGIPIVISGTTAHRYYYDESMVRFFQPCNSEDLARAVLELYQDEQLRNAQVRSSRRFIEENCWSKAKLKYVSIMNGLVFGVDPGSGGKRGYGAGSNTIGTVLERAVSILLATFRGGGSGPGATILAYHEIIDDAWASRAFPDSVTASDFERQMAILREGPFNVVSLEELLSLMESGTAIPPHTVVITFDDGYRDTYTRALPVLREYDIPATVFLAAGFIGLGKPFPWLMPYPADEADAHLPLDWDEVRKLRAAGVSIGSHTLTHPFLPTLDRKGIDQEIGASRKIIEDNIGSPVRLFALPFSFPLSHRSWPSFEAHLAEALGKWSYRCCCTLLRGRVSGGDAPYALRRIPVGRWDDASMFRAKVTGCYSWTRFPQYLYQSFIKAYSAPVHRAGLMRTEPANRIPRRPVQGVEQSFGGAVADASGEDARETLNR